MCGVCVLKVSSSGSLHTVQKNEELPSPKLTRHDIADDSYVRVSSEFPKRGPPNLPQII